MLDEESEFVINMAFNVISDLKLSVNRRSHLPTPLLDYRQNSLEGLIPDLTGFFLEQADNKLQWSLDLAMA